MKCVNCNKEGLITNHRKLCESCNNLYESGKRHGRHEGLKEIKKYINDELERK